MRSEGIHREAEREFEATTDDLSRHWSLTTEHSIGKRVESQRTAIRLAGPHPAWRWPKPIGANDFWHMRRKADFCANKMPRLAYNRCKDESGNKSLVWCVFLLDSS